MSNTQLLINSMQDVSTRGSLSTAYKSYVSLLGQNQRRTNTVVIADGHMLKRCANSGVCVGGVGGGGVHRHVGGEGGGRWQGGWVVCMVWCALPCAHMFVRVCVLLALHPPLLCHKAQLGGC